MATLDGRTRSERVTDPAFSTQLEALDLDGLRTRRRDAEHEEQELSYVRRLLHGRIDILKAELRRRAGHGDGLLENLPTILADTRTNAKPQKRFVSTGGPGHDEPIRTAAEIAAGDSSNSNLTSLTDRELRGVLDSLSAHERSVSELRSQVHRVLDRLSAELTRRYREGTAQVDDLLAAARRS